MKRQYGLDQIERDASSVVTVGTFDGVHVGHRAIIRYLVRRASEREGTSAVVSFDPHPREIVHGDEIPLLTTVEERAELIEQLGIDRFVVIPFTLEFSTLQAEDFVRDILVQRIGLREIVIGYDHAFGRNRRGDADLLGELGQIHGFAVDVIPPQVVEKHVVSSTEIRDALVGTGDVRRARELLGRNYSLTGNVVEGDGRGRQIGFPTANLTVDHPRKVIPAIGVYAVRVYVPPENERPRSARTYSGMMNIGRRPTFDNGEVLLEVHLLDFDGDLYGRHLRVEFVEKMRDERKFDSVEALTEQLSRDRLRCIQLLGAVS